MAITRYGSSVGGGAGGVPDDDSVSTAKLQNLAVTNAKIANATITHGKVAAANIDGIAATASLRTLGTGAQQAAAGNTVAAAQSAADDAQADATQALADAATASTAAAAAQTTANAAAPATRTISTTSPLTGGGDLSADRTFAIPAATAASAGHATAAQITKLDGITAGANIVNPMTTAGDVIVGGASGAAARLAGPTRINQVLRSESGGTPAWGYFINPRTHAWVYEEFTGALIAPWSETNSGTSAITSLSTTFPDANRVGVRNMNTGTTATGRSAIHLQNQQWLFGAGESFLQAGFFTEFLSTAGERYVLRLGAHDGQAGGAPTDGIYFTYSDDINSGNWRCVCVSNSVATNLDTSIAYVQTVWVRLEWFLNAAGTSVEFFIDGVSAGSITTNIPGGAGRYCSPNFIIEKTAGTTNRLVSLDYVFAIKGVTR